MLLFLDFVCFFNHTAPTVLYTSSHSLSPHGALPIYSRRCRPFGSRVHESAGGLGRTRACTAGGVSVCRQERQQRFARALARESRAKCFGNKIGRAHV